MSTFENNLFKLETVEFEALGDRILIREDEFKSGYECEACNGRGKLSCPECGGTGRSRLNAEMLCKSCHGVQHITCPECNGRGGLLITPEISQRRPTTGIIVSAGPQVTSVRVGESVLFSSFAGYAMDINGVVLRLLHEPEILCRVTGHLTMKRSRTDVVEGADSFDHLNLRDASLT